MVVDQSANRRHNSQVSKIRQDGMKLRALGVLASVVEQWFNQKALDEGNMYTSKSTHLHSTPSNFLIRQVYIQAG
jgi:hypothetical protein